MPRLTLQRVPAPALVLVGIASVQTGSAIARTLFDDLGVAGTALWRLFLAAVILLVVLRPPVRTWTFRYWRAAAFLGVALVGMNLVFYLAIERIPLGVAVTVEFMGPLLLALVQTRRPIDFAWALLAGAGVVLLGLDSTGGIAVSRTRPRLSSRELFWVGYILSSSYVGQVVPGVDGLAVALAISRANRPAIRSVTGDCRLRRPRTTHWRGVGGHVVDHHSVRA